MGGCTSKQNISSDHFAPTEESRNGKILVDVFEKEALSLGQIPILGLNLLPNEVIEKIMTYLSFSDLLNLRKEGGRLEGCATKVLKKKPFSKYIIQLIILSYHSFLVIVYSVISIHIIHFL